MHNTHTCQSVGCAVSVDRSEGCVWGVFGCGHVQWWWKYVSAECVQCWVFTVWNVECAQCVYQGEGGESTVCNQCRIVLLCPARTATICIACIPSKYQNVTLTWRCFRLPLSRPRVDFYISSHDQQEAEEHNSYTLSHPLAMTRKIIQHFRADTGELALWEMHTWHYNDTDNQRWE